MSSAQEPNAYERWGPVATGDKVTIEVDMATVTRKGEEFGFFIRELFHPDSVTEKYPGGRAYTVTRWLADCEGQRFKLLQSATYDTADVVIKRFGNAVESSAEWTFALPGSQAETIMGLCKRRQLLDGSYLRATHAYRDSLRSIEAERMSRCRKVTSGIVLGLCARLETNDREPPSYARFLRWQALRDSMFVAMRLRVPKEPARP